MGARTCMEPRRPATISIVVGDDTAEVSHFTCRPPSCCASTCTSSGATELPEGATPAPYVVAMGAGAVPSWIPARARRISLCTTAASFVSSRSSSDPIISFTTSCDGSERAYVASGT